MSQTIVVDFELLEADGALLSLGPLDITIGRYCIQSGSSEGVGELVTVGVGVWDAVGVGVFVAVGAGVWVGVFVAVGV